MAIIDPVKILYKPEPCADIERQIRKLTPRMLSKELKSLEEYQLIKRVAYDRVQVTVEYRLTPHAKTLDKVILELVNWGTLHRKKKLSVSHNDISDTS